MGIFWVLRGKLFVSSFNTCFGRMKRDTVHILGENLSRIWRGRRQRITSGNNLTDELNKPIMGALMDGT